MNAFWASENFDAFIASAPPSQGMVRKTLAKNDPVLRAQITSRPRPTSPPSGSNWIYEIKHDGYRLMARRDPVGIRLITRRGNDWTQRYPARGRGREPPQGAVLPDRRRGGVL